MQSKTTALIQSVIDATLALKKNEAIFLPGEIVVGRSSTGRLRLGHSTTRTWYREPDVEGALREWLAGILDPRNLGHLATQYAREIPLFMQNAPYRAHGIGTPQFQAVTSTGSQEATS